jgi:iron-sulfur cluster assembly accessory protein
MVTLTEAAATRIKEILDNDPQSAGKALRLFVQGGGCAGFQYSFDFDDKQEDDTVVAHDGFDIVIDPMSSVYLMGVGIDYTEDLNGAGFKFTNPNSSGSCGCGKSFAV